MTQDWAADVKKFAPDADDGIIAGIVRYCGIALHSRDASLVSFSDPVETGRVRENFLKKRLGLTDSDEVLDRAIAAVGERMKGVNFKNRVTVYYLLLEHLGLLHRFSRAGAVAETAEPAKFAGAATAGLAAAGAAGAAAAGAIAGAASSASSAATPAVEKVAAIGAATAGAAATSAAAMYPPRARSAPAKSKSISGLGWLALLALAALLLAGIWWLFSRSNAPLEVTAPPAANSAAPAAASKPIDSLSTAPTEGTVAIPAGSGVTVETRDGKPVVKVYFDTAKSDVNPAFSATADGLKAYLASHASSSLAVSGFNDKTGNAAANAVLSQNRAQAVKAALIARGVPEAAIALVKPSSTTDVSVPNAGARRVEVIVR